MSSVFDAVATIKGVTPYSQSAPIRSERPSQERHDQFEERVWRERMHTTPDGRVVIPAMAFKNCLSEAAKYMTQKVPGRGKATYTKHFEAGVICSDDVVLPVKAEDVRGERLFVPSDGVRGSGSRVWKTFPRIEQWGGDVMFTIVDEVITEAAFREHLVGAGQFIGIGRFRPRNNGFYGRFIVERLSWSQREL